MPCVSSAFRPFSGLYQREECATRRAPAPLIGATKPGHIGAALEALTLGLTDEEVARLEAPYLPKAPVGVASTAPRDWSMTRVAR